MLKPNVGSPKGPVVCNFVHMAMCELHGTHGSLERAVLFSFKFIGIFECELKCVNFASIHLQFYIENL